MTTKKDTTSQDTSPKKGEKFDPRRSVEDDKVHEANREERERLEAERLEQSIELGK